MKTIKRIIALSLLVGLLGSTSALTVERCRHCGKVADGVWAKFTAGSCSHFLHDWETVMLSPSDYQKQLKETEAEKMKEQLIIGHELGWW